ncbi:metallophosphoesterase [Pengzhenrongella sicca]|uniref:Metallophosphoesterase n=1 Tax=Pengzhenrongella sicca TaxID=2819238 RepID=A0A8A4ZFA5_9MICO|nr:metallophosphoesterase [Pengzhenrongella sicca]QTE29226.1 metallophosphoesterase [Pengzhenrongella sicca]
MAPRILPAVGALAAAGAAAVAWGALVEVRWYALREVTVPVLPPGQDPLRVLHLSDLHLSPSQRRKIDWIRDLATLQPDLVIDTGDNMGHVDALPAVLEALDPLLGTPGAFVMGSNDYYAPMAKNPLRYLRSDAGRRVVRTPRELPADKLAAELVAAGWRDLDNRRDTIAAGGRRIALVGVDDPHFDRDILPAADAATTGPFDLRLGVAHAPYTRILDEMQADGADVIFAGHTHGGQLAIPFYGALVTNCDLDTGRAKGLHGWPGARPDEADGAGSTWMHVSAGLGTSVYAPVRFACRPEATLLTLVARAES